MDNIQGIQDFIPIELWESCDRTHFKYVVVRKNFETDGNYRKILSLAFHVLPREIPGETNP